MSDPDLDFIISGRRPDVAAADGGDDTSDPDLDFIISGRRPDAAARTAPVAEGVDARAKAPATRKPLPPIPQPEGALAAAARYLPDYEFKDVGNAALGAMSGYLANFGDEIGDVGAGLGNMAAAALGEGNPDAPPEYKDEGVNPIREAQGTAAGRAGEVVGNVAGGVRDAMMLPAGLARVGATGAAKALQGGSGLLKGLGAQTASGAVQNVAYGAGARDEGNKGDVGDVTWDAIIGGAGGALGELVGAGTSWLRGSKKVPEVPIDAPLEQVAATPARPATPSPASYVDDGMSAVEGGMSIAEPGQIGVDYQPVAPPQYARPSLPASRPQAGMSSAEGGMSIAQPGEATVAYKRVPDRSGPVPVPDTFYPATHPNKNIASGAGEHLIGDAPGDLAGYRSADVDTAPDLLDQFGRSKVTGEKVKSVPQELNELIVGAYKRQGNPALRPSEEYGYVRKPKRQAAADVDELVDEYDAAEAAGLVEPPAQKPKQKQARKLSEAEHEAMLEAMLANRAEPEFGPLQVAGEARVVDRGRAGKLVVGEDPLRDVADEMALRRQEAATPAIPAPPPEGMPPPEPTIAPAQRYVPAQVEGPLDVPYEHVNYRNVNPAEAAMSAIEADKSFANVIKLRGVPRVSTDYLPVKPAAIDQYGQPFKVDKIEIPQEYLDAANDLPEYRQSAMGAGNTLAKMLSTGEKGVVDMSVAGYMPPPKMPKAVPPGAAPAAPESELDQAVRLAGRGLDFAARRSGLGGAFRLARDAFNGMPGIQPGPVPRTGGWAGAVRAGDTALNDYGDRTQRESATRAQAAAPMPDTRTLKWAMQYVNAAGGSGLPSNVQAQFDRALLSGNEEQIAAEYMRNSMKYPAFQKQMIEALQRAQEYNP